VHGEAILADLALLWLVLLQPPPFRLIAILVLVLLLLVLLLP